LRKTKSLLLGLATSSIAELRQLATEIYLKLNSTFEASSKLGSWREVRFNFVVGPLSRLRVTVTRRQTNRSFLEFQLPKPTAGPRR
jgi:hypothetical protein